VFVELAAEREALAARPGVPDRADRPDELLHACRRPPPRHREASLDVRLDLRAEPQLEPAPGDQLEVVGEHRDVHRVAREGHRDRRLQSDPLGGPGRQRQRGEHVMLGLGRAEPGIPVLLGGRRRGLDLERGGRDVGGEVHQHDLAP
jgi:hypothetical protein